jgi:hypothetical protein
MSNVTYSSPAFRTAAPAGSSLLRQLFTATPFYIFYTAIKSALEKRWWAARMDRGQFAHFES